MDSAWQPSELDDTRAAEHATVPLSPGSPERETLSFDTPARLVRQDEFREETGARTDDNDYSEPPHPEVTRAEDDESDSSPDSQDSREDLQDGTKCFVLDVLDLQRLRAVQLCTLGPPHGCEEYWHTHTDEEYNVILRWADQAGKSGRLDIECDENGHYSRHGRLSFSCSLLREIRRFRE